MTTYIVNGDVPVRDGGRRRRRRERCGSGSKEAEGEGEGEGGERSAVPPPAHRTGDEARVVAGCSTRGPRRRDPRADGRGRRSAPRSARPAGHLFFGGPRGDRI